MLINNTMHATLCLKNIRFEDLAIPTSTSITKKIGRTFTSLLLFPARKGLFSNPLPSPHLSSPWMNTVGFPLVKSVSVSFPLLIFKFLNYFSENHNECRKTGGNCTSVNLLLIGKLHLPDKFALLNTLFPFHAYVHFIGPPVLVPIFTKFAFIVLITAAWQFATERKSCIVGKLNFLLNFSHPNFMIVKRTN